MKNNQKRYIIDINHFLKESEMDLSNWFEAWVHYLMFLEWHADATLLWWKEHHVFLAGQDDFKQNFEAILTFDIEMRTMYAIQPHPHDECKYCMCFSTIKLQVMQCILTATNLTMAASIMNLNISCPNTSPSSSCNASSNSCFQPYPGNECDNFHPSGSTSFWSTSNPPTCISCQWEHCVNICTEEKSKEGKLMFMKYTNGKLVWCGDGCTICISHNISCSGCTKSHTDLYICSFCGSSSHEAMPLHHLIEFLNHLTFNPVPIIPKHVPYLDYLIKTSSSHDSDLNFSKIWTPYSLITFCYDLLSHQEQVQSYHHGLFFFSAQPCVLPPSLPFVIVHSCLLCYL